MIVRVIDGGLKLSPVNVPDPKRKDFHCQVDLGDGSRPDIPIFFCTLYDSRDEAATQCHIPDKRNIGNLEASQRSPRQGTKCSKVQIDHLQQTIEEVIEKARQERDDDHSLDSIHAIEHFDAYEVERPEDQRLTEDQGPSCIGSLVAKQGRSPEQETQAAGEQSQSSDHHKKGAEEQPVVSKKG